LNIEVSLDKLLMEEGGFKKLLELVSHPNSKLLTTKEPINWSEEASLSPDILDRIKSLAEKKAFSTDSGIVFYASAISYSNQLIRKKQTNRGRLLLDWCDWLLRCLPTVRPA